MTSQPKMWDRAIDAQNSQPKMWDRAIDAPPIFFQARDVTADFFQAKDVGQIRGVLSKIKKNLQKMKKTPQKQPYHSPPPKPTCLGFFYSFPSQ
jgi:hypothetical protein